MPKPKRELTAYNLFIQVGARRALAACNAGALTRGAPPNAVQAGASQGGGVHARSWPRGSPRSAVHAYDSAQRALALAHLRCSAMVAHARASLIGRPSCPNWPPRGADARHAARCLPRQHPELTHTEAFAQAAHAVRSPRRGVVGTGRAPPPGCRVAQLIRPGLAWCSRRSRAVEDGPVQPEDAPRGACPPRGLHAARPRSLGPRGSRARRRSGQAQGARRRCCRRRPRRRGAQGACHAGVLRISALL